MVAGCRKWLWRHAAAAAVVTDAKLQTNIKIICLAYALHAAQFGSFYPHFVEALDAAARCEPNQWDTAKFLADGHFRFFAVFVRGILGGAQSGPRRRSGRRRLGLSFPFRGMCRSNGIAAASYCSEFATWRGAWSTISSIASQIGGPLPPVPNSAHAARAAMFMSQLAALQPPA